MTLDGQRLADEHVDIQVYDQRPQEKNKLRFSPDRIRNNRERHEVESWVEAWKHDPSRTVDMVKFIADNEGRLYRAMIWPQGKEKPVYAPISQLARALGLRTKDAYQEIHPVIQVREHDNMMIDAFATPSIEIGTHTITANSSPADLRVALQSISIDGVFRRIENAAVQTTAAQR